MTGTVIMNNTARRIMRVVPLPWKRLWMRSIEKCKFRYTTVVSDGNSKAYTAIVNEKIYGEDVEIKKNA
ncbi:hypothetical protein E2C01_095516 [Portunus trituberculatus]|uniref:Uncharacterized protein n=1 Tax=Portunus trituberculatus TaxID=210409 RepID=A0A5B7K421_PORTR|nr:hypothetical protein [Portunus trituberculatus]